MVARKVIAVVAATSFAVIVLVFAFVFREAVPFFFPPDPAPAAGVAADGARGSSGGTQESYGDVQETYGSDPSVAPGLARRRASSRASRGRRPGSPT